MTDDELEKSYAVLMGIRRARRERDIDYLIDALIDVKWRARAAKRLGELGDLRAAGPLRRLLAADDGYVRSQAAVALGKLGDRESVPELISIASGDPEWYVRSWANQALGRIRDVRAVPVLTGQLSDPNARLAASAGEALGLIGDPEALPALRTAAAHVPRRVRRVFKTAAKEIEHAQT